VDKFDSYSENANTVTLAMFTSQCIGASEASLRRSPDKSLTN